MDNLHALQLAVDQLQRLRRENEILRARVESFHLAGQFLMAKPVENYQGSEVDALHYLQKMAQEEGDKRVREEQTKQADKRAMAPEYDEARDGPWPQHAMDHV